MPTPSSNSQDGWCCGLVTALGQLGLPAREAERAETIDPAALRISSPQGSLAIVVDSGPADTGGERFRETITAAAEQAATIEGFTVYLTEAYDTIDLLYTIGAAPRDLTQPARFIDLVLSRLFKTLNFAYFAAVFDSGGTAPPPLSSVIATDGDLPLPRGQFVEAVRNFLPPESPQGWTVCPTISDLLPPEGRNDTGLAEGQVLVQTLKCRGGRSGLLLAGGKHGADLSISSYDIQLVRAAAGHLDSFCDNVALFEEQRTLFIGTVGALAAAIDAKDSYTFGHSERVSLISGQIAEAMGMSAKEVETIRLSGLVHDVGKIGVSELVLRKPGRLTEEEFAEIKRHPEIGWGILSGIVQLADVLPGVLHHHERWDGAGYPHGKRGDEIPLIARIIGVADTFDAMSSSRSYRDGMPREKVLRIIAECTGTQLDARVVEAFFRINLADYDRAAAASAEPRRLAA